MIDYPWPPSVAAKDIDDCWVGKESDKVQLYTMLFQTFVFMQLFNLINAKKLGDKDFNIFAGFFNNCFFLGILVLCFVIQISLVYVGGRALRCTPLTAHEQMTCGILGAGVLIWGAIIKVILPGDCSFFAWLEKSAIKNEEIDEEEVKGSMMATLRRSQSLQNLVEKKKREEEV